MYGMGSRGYPDEESDDEYDVFAEVERERVVKTYSKESATSKMQWNTRQEQEQLKSFKDLALVGNDPTKEPGKGEATFPKNRNHRQNGPAGVLFSTFGFSAATHHDTSSRLDSSSAGHAGSFASSNNFMGNKDGSPATSQKEDSESAYTHFSSGIVESSSEQQHRHSKDNNFPVTLSRMSIGAAYGAMKNTKSNQN